MILFINTNTCPLWSLARGGEKMMSVLPELTTSLRDWLDFLFLDLVYLLLNLTFSLCTSSRSASTWYLSEISWASTLRGEFRSAAMIEKTSFSVAMLMHWMINKIWFIVKISASFILASTRQELLQQTLTPKITGPPASKLRCETSEPNKLLLLSEGVKTWNTL